MILQFLPLMISTAGLIIVSFAPIPKKKKTLAVIFAFIMWLSIFGISWGVFWR